MEKEKVEWVVKTVSAPKGWWDMVEAAQAEAGITSRAQFIRTAISKYIEWLKEGKS